MKRTYLLIFVLLFSVLGVFAQAPQKISYQAIVRSSGDVILTNQNIGMQISILQGSSTGTAVYIETQNPTTNANGLATIEIGTGTVVSGTFATIDWANDSYYVKTEIDTFGGTNYTITGTSQLMSVPYALYAASSGSSVVVEDVLTSTSTTAALSANQGRVLENTKLSNVLANGTVFIGNGTNNAVAQTLSGDATLANDGTLTITDDAVDGTDISLTNEAAGDVMYNDGTNWVRLPKGTAGQVLAMNSTGTAPEWKTVGGAKRIGEFVYAKTGKTEADGYLAVVPGTITDGALNYPLWAAQYPEFVSGNDIVFPADVAGMFLRNNGGNAGVEGTYQSYRTARPTNQFTTNTTGNHAHSFPVYNNDGAGPGAADGRNGVSNSGSTHGAGNHSHVISGGGDVETNPQNRAYQLYTIIDTY